MTYSYLIIGAGLTGCVFAERIATQLNKKVLIIDKRDHIGGNCFDYYDNEGILIHKYGPHWFHTNNKPIFEYLSNFTEWRFHSHIVKSYVDGMFVPFPININTINQLYNTNYSTSIEIQKFYDSVRIKDIINPKNAEEMVISQVGYELYEKFFKNYTTKQWGITPKLLQASITSRIPIRTDNDNRYFTDFYQGIPKYGYSKMFENMTANKNITIALNTDYNKITDLSCFNKIIYTGPIDSYFNNLFGPLPSDH